MKNRFEKTQKGFSFSFDGLIAVIILFGVFAFIASSASTATEFAGQNLTKTQVADDMLNTAVKLSVFDTYNQTQIETFFTDNLPKNFDYSIEINSYSLSTSFTLDNNYSFGNTTKDLSDIDYVEQKRTFLTYNGSDIDKYNIVKLRAWGK